MVRLVQRSRLLTLCLVAAALAPPTIAGQGGTRETPPPPPPQQQQEDAKRPGQAEFDRVCKACHGPEAGGDAGPRLVPFTREYEEVLGIVREGAGQMPPISIRELTDDDVAQIVGYLKALSP